MECNSAIHSLIKGLISLSSGDGQLKDAEESVSTISPIFEKYAGDHRKLMYYLFLNSDHDLADELKDDYDIGLLISSYYVLPNDWILRLASFLQTESYLVELAQYGQLGLVIPLIHSSFNIFEPEKYYGLYEKLGAVIQSRIISEKTIYNVTLKHFLLEIIKRLSKATCDALLSSSVELGGHLFHAFLKCIKFILEHKQTERNEDLLHFYALQKKYSVKKITLLCHDSGLNIECELFVLLQNILQGFSLNLWISLADIYASDGECLQTIIGNIIYDLCEQFNNIIPTAFLQCFNHFKIKPISEEMIIQRSSLKEIVDVIETRKKPNIRKWFQKLVNISEAWNDPSVVCVIMKNVSLADNIDELIELYIKTLLEKERESVKDFAIGIKNLNLPLQLKILSNICQSSKLSRLYSVPSSNFIEEFNKLLNEFSVDDFLSNNIHLVLQHPLEFTRNIFEKAISSENQTMCIDILDKIRCVLLCCNFKDPDQNKLVSDNFLINVVCSRFITENCFTELQYISFLNFFDKLDTNYFLPRNFVSTFIIPSLETAVKNCNWNTSKLLLEILKRIPCAVAEDTGFSDAPFVGLLTEILHVTSWDINSYEVDQGEVNDLTASIIIEFVENIINEGKENDLLWLRNYIKKFSHEIQTHFAVILEKSDFENYDCFEKILLLTRKSKLVGQSRPVQNELEYYLLIAKVLPSLHPWEWNSLLGIYEHGDYVLSFGLPEPELLPYTIIARALSILITCIESSNLALLERCMKGFTGLLEQCLDQLSIEHHLTLLTSFLIPINVMKNVELQDKYYLISIPIMKSSLNSIIEFEKPHNIESFYNTIIVQWRHEFLQNKV